MVTFGDKPVPLCVQLVKLIKPSKRTKGCFTRDSMLHMMFKLGRCAEKTWRRLQGFRQLAQVIEGMQFTDGIETTTQEGTRRRVNNRPDTTFDNSLVTG